MHNIKSYFGLKTNNRNAYRLVNEYYSIAIAFRDLKQSGDTIALMKRIKMLFDKIEYENTGNSYYSNNQREFKLIQRIANTDHANTQADMACKEPTKIEYVSSDPNLVGLVAALKCDSPQQSRIQQLTDAYYKTSYPKMNGESLSEWRNILKKYDRKISKQHSNNIYLTGISGLEWNYLWCSTQLVVYNSTRSVLTTIIITPDLMKQIFELIESELDKMMCVDGSYNINVKGPDIQIEHIVDELSNENHTPIIYDAQLGTCNIGHVIRGVGDSLLQRFV